MLRKIVLILTLALTACSTAAPVTPTVMPAPSLTPTTTITVTPSPQPTATPEYFTTQCLDTLPALPTDFELGENIVFSGYEKIYIADLPTKNIVQNFDGDTYEYDGISPDGKWLAFKDSNNLIVASMDGKQTIKLPWDKRWKGKLFWLDQEHIMMKAFVQSEQENPDNPSAVVINPFTKDQRDLPVSEFPDLLWVQGTGLSSAFQSGTAIYNPALSQALYAQSPETVVLWDLQNKRAIASLGGYRHSQPAFWSSAKNKFLLTLTYGLNNKKYFNNWFELDQEGNTRQLTHFEEMYRSSKAAVNFVTLSRDGEKIAFWLDSENNQDFFVLNTQTDTLTKYCFSGVKPSFPVRASWSLNNRFLIMGGGPSETWFLIDLQRNWIIEMDKITDQQMPNGFVAKP